MKAFFKNNLKFILGIFLGLMITGITAYALTVPAGQISYDNTTSGMTSTNVAAALDELYTKAENVPSGPACAVKLGDYISLTPAIQNFTIKTSLTGYTSDQTINPSELNLWRVIDIHNDCSFDVVSEYVSSTNVYLQGTIGYANCVGTLNTIATQYQVPGYTIGSRHMGYGGQTSIIGDTSGFDGTTNTAPSTTTTPYSTTGTGQEYQGGVAGDTLYLKDYTLVSNVYKSDTATYGDTGLKAYKTGTTTATRYWLASRHYYGSTTDFGICGHYVYTNGTLDYDCFRTFSNSWRNYAYPRAVRPILTVKSGITTSGGNGSKTVPYTLS